MEQINNSITGNHTIIFSSKLRDRFINDDPNEERYFLYQVSCNLADILGDDLILTESTFSSGTYYFFFQRTDTTEKNDQTLRTKILDVLKYFNKVYLPDKEIHIFPHRIFSSDTLINKHYTSWVQQ